MKLEEFSEAEFQKALQRTIRALTRGKKVPAQPRAILLGGQSGAGKTTIHRIKQMEFQGNIIIIDGDSMRSDEFSEGTFYTICRNLINSYDNIPTEYLFILRDALLMVPIVEYERKKFHLSEIAFDQLHRIMEETQDYQKKPLLRMLEGQYLYVVKKDIFGAKKAYQEGIILARLLGDEFLVDTISEKMRDTMKE